MTTLKYSRQREAIKKYLMATKEHPTADIVYLHVKEEFPNISLGTVYRNLNLLTDIGEALKIPSPDGADRFDGNAAPHNHFFCTECGRVLDLNLDIKKLEEINTIVSRNFDGKIESSSVTFNGKCSKCVKKSHKIQQ
ncbi:Fur family transcriptional regulator [Clostridium sp. C105KSO13]|uniref:Fur family transcriptional regulator n=1 Tax=Clostridium sp. C105KSO13 TaxID=1776045 RepID=UPI00074080C6|nr:transcriptional repressor [Clostridium sp. C105KSO13]CUX26996.1 Peroxide-responsive repressor PerR [Clostridium sp. C105KSO13]